MGNSFLNDHSFGAPYGTLSTNVTNVIVEGKETRRDDTQIQSHLRSGCHSALMLLDSRVAAVSGINSIGGFVNVESYGWYSNRVNKHMEFLRVGTAGAPVIVFPTSGGDHREFGDRGMLRPLEWKIDQGLIQVFCINTNSWEGWYNEHLHPRQKVEMQVAYEEYLIHELLPALRNFSGTDVLILTGISFGAYHAMNFTLKHPDLVTKVVTFSGSFSIKGFLEGYYDDLCYFNNPVDYLRNLSDQWYIDMFNTCTDLTIVTSDGDVCLDRNLELAGILTSKGIRHNYYQWDASYKHDWPHWEKMIAHYI